MKVSQFGLAALFALSACTHSGGGSSSTPAASPAPTTTANTFGTVNGQAGGQCTPEVIADDKKMQQVCSSIEVNDGTSMENCQKAMTHFSDKYGNVDCTATDADGTQITIKIDHSQGSGTQSSVTDACAQRASAMTTLEQNAQAKLEEATHAAFQGRSVSSDGIKNQLSTFEAKYSDAGCSGKSNGDFEDEINRFTEEIDQLQ